MRWWVYVLNGSLHTYIIATCTENEHQRDAPTGWRRSKCEVRGVNTRKKDKPSEYNCSPRTLRWSFSVETQQIQHVSRIRARKERTKTHTHAHARTDAQARTSTHKSEQVVSAPSGTFNWIHLQSQRRCSAHPPHTTPCRRNFKCLHFLAPFRILCQYQPSYFMRRKQIFYCCSDFLVLLLPGGGPERRQRRQERDASGGVCTKACWTPGCFLAGSWPDERRWSPGADTDRILAAGKRFPMRPGCAERPTAIRTSPQALAGLVKPTAQNILTCLRWQAPSGRRRLTAWLVRARMLCFSFWLLQYAWKTVNPNAVKSDCGWFS